MTRTQWYLTGFMVFTVLVGWCGAEVAAEFPRCEEPSIVTEFGGELSAHDRRALAGAKIQCGFRYPRSPCVAEFKVTGFQSYQVKCRAEVP